MDHRFFNEKWLLNNENFGLPRVDCLQSTFGTRWGKKANLYFLIVELIELSA